LVDIRDVHKLKRVVGRGRYTGKFEGDRASGGLHVIGDGKEIVEGLLAKLDGEFGGVSAGRSPSDGNWATRCEISGYGADCQSTSVGSGESENWNNACFGEHFERKVLEF